MKPDTALRRVQTPPHDRARLSSIRPQVVFLDEPTTGLDPQARMAVLGTRRSSSGRPGMAVVLTTHYMDEAERLSDRLVLLAGRQGPRDRHHRVQLLGDVVGEHVVIIALRRRRCPTRRGGRGCARAG